MSFLFSSPFFSTAHFHFFSNLCLSAAARRCFNLYNYSNILSTSMASLRGHRRHKEKVVVIMGATGTGKSRLSVDLADHFPAEIINSDKIQVYRGLDTTTNKTPLPDRRSVPHHILGQFDPAEAEIAPAHFRRIAAAEVASVASRRSVPFLVGGSNSFVHALVADRFDPASGDGGSISPDLRYRCCFVWVDVSFPVLSDYLSIRVDDMLDSGGMFEELADYFSDRDASSEAGRGGLGKAIGVPEFEKYFRKYPPGGAGGRERPGGSDQARRGAYEEAVREVKENTRRLVKKQMGKIQRLRDAGWDLKRVDATEAFRALLANDSGRRWSEVWEREVVVPSVKIVKHFLEDDE